MGVPNINIANGGESSKFRRCSHLALLSRWMDSEVLRKQPLGILPTIVLYAKRRNLHGFGIIQSDNKSTVVIKQIRK